MVFFTASLKVKVKSEERERRGGAKVENHRIHPNQPISIEDALQVYVKNIYFNKEIISKKPKITIISHCSPFAKIDLLAKTRVECELYASSSLTRFSFYACFWIYTT